jgi:Tol biopolymer transport system component
MVSSSTARRLTTDGRRKLAPAFLAAGEIAFAAHEVPNRVAIVRLKDGVRQLMHPLGTEHQFDPAFSRDGRHHAFARSAASPQLVLVIQDLREKREAVFRPRDARATARCPTFAPDGTRVVFALSDVGGQQIASVDLEGKNLKRLTASAGLNAAPAFSPDGRRIAFSSSRDGDFEIYVMAADGSDVRRLTRSVGIDTRPAWSPDGRRIAFTSNRDGRYQVYVMNADGSGQRRARDHAGRDDYAAWHPDGRRLLVVSEQGGKSDLYLLEVPG